MSCCTLQSPAVARQHSIRFREFRSFRGGIHLVSARVASVCPSVTRRFPEASPSATFQRSCGSSKPRVSLRHRPGPIFSVVTLNFGAYSLESSAVVFGFGKCKVARISLNIPKLLFWVWARLRLWPTGCCKRSLDVIP